MNFDNFSHDLLFGSDNLHMTDQYQGTVTGHHSQFGNTVFHTDASGMSEGYSTKFNNSVNHYDNTGQNIGSSRMIGNELHHFDNTGMDIGHDVTTSAGTFHYSQNGMYQGRTDNLGHEYAANGMITGFSFKKFG